MKGPSFWDLLLSHSGKKVYALGEHRKKASKMIIAEAGLVRKCWNHWV